MYKVYQRPKLFQIVLNLEPAVCTITIVPAHMIMREPAKRRKSDALVLQSILAGGGCAAALQFA